MPINYQLGKIYKIVDYDNNNIFIGSTCEPILSRKLAVHRSNYNKYIKGKTNHYAQSYEILKNGNYSIVLIEYYPCHSKDQLIARERCYIENYDCINKHISDKSK
jgi:hypothetical protein